MLKTDYERFKSFFMSRMQTYSAEEEIIRENLELKFKHTKMVCENTVQITEHLKLKETEQLLALTIALFHDLGRFEQFIKYRTFVDRNSVDHALLGKKILEESEILQGLSNTEQEIILQSVFLHNKFSLSLDLGEEQRLQLKIIRDADKWDIFRVFAEYFSATNGRKNSAIEGDLPETEGYNSQILNDILEGRNTSSEFVQNLTDSRMYRLSWLYDLNFSFTKKRIRESGYVESMIKAIPQEIPRRMLERHFAEYLNNNILYKGE